MPTSADEGHLQMRSAKCARRRNDRIPKLRPPADEACKYITLDPRELGSRFERARLRRPRLAPRPAPRPRRKTTQYGPNGYAGERGAAPPPEQLTVPAANAPPGFPGRSGISAGPCTPRMCWALFDRGTIGSKKGVLPVPGPPNGFCFRFPTRKNGVPNRTRRGTTPQDGRRYAVPPSTTGQASESPAFWA